MHERALWARNKFIESPKESQVDDELLVWCFNYEDNLWYSTSGNYSSYSPEEKRIKEDVRLKQLESYQKSGIQIAMEYYQQVLYQSHIRKLVLERDKYTCQKCGAEAPSKFHIHHIEKREEGGTDHLDNLITVCPKCHPKVDSKEYNPPWKKNT